MTNEFAQDSMRRRLKEKYDKALEQAKQLEEAEKEEKAGEQFLKAARLSQQLVEYEQGEEWKQLRADNARKLRFKASKLGVCNYRPSDLDDGGGAVESSWTPEKEVEISEPEEVEIDSSESGEDGAGEPDAEESGENGTNVAGNDGESAVMDEVEEVLNSPERMVGEPPDLDYSDYGGRQELKDNLEEKVLDYFERKELYQKRNLSPENTVMLVGEPGQGKTYFAKCLAGEMGYSFIEVKIADIVSKYIGEAAKKVRAVFMLAEQNAPCILFVDELEAVGGDRSGDMNTSEQQAINQLLDSISEVQGSEVVVVGATNRMEDLDRAILRSGRFGTRYEVGMPDQETRHEILKVHLEKHKIDWTPQQVAEAVDRLGGCTPADIQAAVKSAARKSIQESNKNELKQVTMHHFEEALQEVKAQEEEV